MQLHDIIAWVNTTLDSEGVNDYGPNGLQVEASSRLVKKVAMGVTSNLRFIEDAAEWGADLAIVHHGIYWNGASPTITGALGARVRRLLENNLSLAGYHLPLDAHPTLGNAVSLANELGIASVEPAFHSRGVNVGCIGRLPSPISANTLLAGLKERVSPTTIGFCHGPADIRTIGIVTGGAAREVNVAIKHGCDAYITGEAGEYSQATAYEEGIHFFAAGHHRTERFGPQALGNALAERFSDLEVTFIDVDNPI
jgi:dinuclear metal center YbgI/SA1388 family protein